MLNAVATHFVWESEDDKDSGYATFFKGTAEEVTVPMPSLGLALVLGSAINDKLQQAYYAGKSKIPLQGTQGSSPSARIMQLSSVSACSFRDSDRPG